MNIEDIYERAPAALEISKVKGAESRDNEFGIVLSLEGVVNAIKTYGTGMIEGSNAANEARYGTQTDGFLTTEDEERYQLAIERVTNDALQALRARHTYEGMFGYDYKKTPFFGAQIRIERREGRYVMEISAEYEGTRVEDRLAEALGADRAMESADAVFSLERVREWWYNLDLRATLGKVVLKQYIPKVARRMINGGIDIKLKDNGYSFKPTVNAEETRYLRTDGYLVTGPAWTKWNERGEACEPRQIEPQFTIKVRHSGAAVTGEGKAKLQGIRDSIMRLIMKA